MRREPTSYERRLAASARNARGPFVTHANLAMTAGAFVVLAIAILGSRGGPVCVGWLGVPLLVVQLCCGLVPALSRVSREPMTRAARLRLLLPAIGGPLVTLSALVYAAQAGSMC